MADKVSKQKKNAAISANNLNGLRNRALQSEKQITQLRRAQTPRGNGPSYFKIVTIANDYLTANPYFPGNDSVGSDVVPIAKPYMLRHAPFEGETITFPNADEIEYTYDATNPERKRESDDGSSTRTQLMTPMYYVGEVVRATPIWTGLSDASNNEIVWEDDNTAGRHWAS